MSWQAVPPRQVGGGSYKALVYLVDKPREFLGGRRAAYCYLERSIQAGSWLGLSIFTLQRDCAVWNR